MANSKKLSERAPDFVHQSQADSKFVKSSEPSVKLGKRVIKAEPDMTRVKQKLPSKGGIPVLIRPIVKQRDSKND